MTKNLLELISGLINLSSTQLYHDSVQLSKNQIHPILSPKNIIDLPEKLFIKLIRIYQCRVYTNLTPVTFDYLRIYMIQQQMQIDP